MTRVGVTGHQRLDEPKAWSWVATTMRAELARMTPPLTALTSLAIGADQLLARLVLEAGGKIHAVLPFADIERSFSIQDLSAYRELARQATLEVLHKPKTDEDEDAYLAAGHRVVDLSDIVIAVWDGKTAKGKGGTADIVGYALRRGTPLIHIDPILRTVQRLEPNGTANVG
ncbi:MAG TPA: hypothetical protein VNX88_16825 [Terriglobales bacterium]|nr:hypothetical protein [Terriglobales bacterium]